MHNDVNLYTLNNQTPFSAIANFCRGLMHHKISIKNVKKMHS